MICYNMSMYYITLCYAFNFIGTRNARGVHCPTSSIQQQAPNQHEHISPRPSTYLIQMRCARNTLVHC